MNMVLPPPSSPSGLTPALMKLIDVLEEENAVLSQHRLFFHGSFTDRKNQALRELMAAQKSEALSLAAQKARPLLRHLERALHDNARLLKLHITAVGEISDIIIGSLRAAESDGTYSRSELSRGC
ncbi:hypothetical protein [Aestuariivirga sp.]|jgi:hypothetical protein|uniref:hypothetical protein n=1 Tax=Aestuariivirga sp. TaxID=2650926 RepID=UPI003BA9BFD5